MLSSASESAGATRALLARVPAWSALSAVVGLPQEPAWLADALLASRTQFLFNVLTPCVAAAPKVPSQRPVVRLHRCVNMLDTHWTPGLRVQCCTLNAEFGLELHLGCDPSESISRIDALALFWRGFVGPKRCPDFG